VAIAPDLNILLTFHTAASLPALIPRPLLFSTARGVNEQFQDNSRTAATGLVGAMVLFAFLIFGRSPKGFCLAEALARPAVGVTAGLSLISDLSRSAWLSWLDGPTRGSCFAGANPIADRPQLLEEAGLSRSKELLLGWIREAGGDRLPWPGSSRPTTRPPSNCTTKSL